METKLFHRKSNGEVKVWECAVDGNLVTRMWGQQGGQMSCTQHRFKDNAHASADDRARAYFTKLVTGRKEKGYVRSLGQVMADVRVSPSGSELNFDKPLPSNFAPGKPFKSFDPKEMAVWEKAGKLVVQRKFDGMRHHLVSDSKGDLKIYSSGKENMTDHLRPLLEGIVLPPRTVLDLELTVNVEDEHGPDDFNRVASICRSLSGRAQAQIKMFEKTGNVISLRAFDVLWHKGDAVFRRPYKERYELLRQICDTKVNERSHLVRLMQTGVSLADSIDLVRAHGWEGLVVWRVDQGSMVRLNGSPDRVNCWKVKPINEEDVVAYGWEPGKGRNSKVLGKFLIGMFDRKGNLVEMGKCGTGLDDATREAAMQWKYPCVIQIEYDRKSKSGFRFPVFIRKRRDKEPGECVG